MYCRSVNAPRLHADLRSPASINVFLQAITPLHAHTSYPSSSSTLGATGTAHTTYSSGASTTFSKPSHSFTTYPKASDYAAGTCVGKLGTWSGPAHLLYMLLFNAVGKSTALQLTDAAELRHTTAVVTDDAHANLGQHVTHLWYHH